MVLKSPARQYYIKLGTISLGSLDFMMKINLQMQRRQIQMII